MFGCKEVISEKMRDIDKVWKGTDNASLVMRLKKRVQYWLAVGPLGKHGYCKAREYPKTLFMIHGVGVERESPDGPYLSRIQNQCSWHIALRYPFFLTFHIFWDRHDIVPVGEYKSDFGFKKLFNGYLGWGRDDQPFYYPKVYAGGNFE